MKFKWILYIMSIFSTTISVAQDSTNHVDIWSVDTLIQPVPLQRALFVDKINKQIKRLDARDGATDEYIYYIDSVKSGIVTRAIMNQAPLLTINIENLDVDNNTKLTYLRQLETILIRFNNKNWMSVEPTFFKNVLDNFKGFIQAEQGKNVLEFVKQHADLYMYDNQELLNDYLDAKNYLYEVIGKQYPDMMVKNLSEYADKPYADPVIAAAAKTQPGTILNYAMSTTKMGTAVRRNKDPYVQTIVKIADLSRNPLKALPFLDDIYSGKKTIDEVDAFVDDDVKYFKSLVALRLSETNNHVKKLDNEIEYRALKFIRVINELHNSPDAVRFKSIEPFNAEELYFMTIGGQDEIYTSSFINGTFKKLMAQMKPKPGNEFLDKVNHAHFRTFIRMCAGFNTLEEFLATFEGDEKNKLMKEFVANLEQGSPDDLEDAVDVADAFGSINDKDLQDFLKQEVKDNYERIYRDNAKKNKKGVVVYGLLSTIFNSDKNSQTDDLPIPPITYVPYTSLVDGANGVVEQVFFYGDKDGMGAYNNFLNQYRNNKWKIASTKYWTTITSTGNTKMTIYVNIPLPEETGQDEEAQKQLQAYLDENNIQPTIIVHRGHSYYLPTTIEYLSPNVKVVMLGSCGGYHNLAQVLDRSPDANIISSKQVGALRVNVPIINEINNYASSGRDMDWIAMWKDLSKRFAGSGSVSQDLFSDYVPPNKNLGAIFIKAYRKVTESDLMN